MHIVSRVRKRILHLHVLQKVCRHCKNFVLNASVDGSTTASSNDTKLGNAHLSTYARTAVRENALVTPYRMVEYDKEKRDL